MTSSRAQRKILSSNMVSNTPNVCNRNVYPPVCTKRPRCGKCATWAKRKSAEISTENKRQKTVALRAENYLLHTEYDVMEFHLRELGKT